VEAREAAMVRMESEYPLADSKERLTHLFPTTKFIVSAFQSYQSEEAFWVAFSHPAGGRRMTYTEINKRLRKARTQRDAADVALAKVEYGADVVDGWSYRRGAGQVRIKTVNGLAERYRFLKGLPQDGEDD
jgi:hypothetical protein